MSRTFWGAEMCFKGSWLTLQSAGSGLPPAGPGAAATTGRADLLTSALNGSFQRPPPEGGPSGDPDLITGDFMTDEICKSMMCWGGLKLQAVAECRLLNLGRSLAPGDSHVLQLIVPELYL